MKIESLTSMPDGAVAAVIVMADGDRLEVNFSTLERAGIRVANPDRPLFEQSGMGATEVRGIIAAVLAFVQVATHAPQRPE